MTTENVNVIEIIMNMKKDDDQYLGTTPILESDPIRIPNARQCRVNHGLVAAIPSGDITLSAWKARVKSLEKRKKEIEKLKK